MLIAIFRHSYSKEFPKFKKRKNVDILSNLMALKAYILFMQYPKCLLIIILASCIQIILHRAYVNTFYIVLTFILKEIFL